MNRRRIPLVLFSLSVLLVLLSIVLIYTRAYKTNPDSIHLAEALAGTSNETEEALRRVGRFQFEVDHEQSIVTCWSYSRKTGGTLFFIIEDGELSGIVTPPLRHLQIDVGRNGRRAPVRRSIDPYELVLDTLQQPRLSTAVAIQVLRSDNASNSNLPPLAIFVAAMSPRKRTEDTRSQQILVGVPSVSVGDRLGGRKRDSPDYSAP